MVEFFLELLTRAIILTVGICWAVGITGIGIWHIVRAVKNKRRK